jgi:hypothetical protein
MRYDQRPCPPSQLQGPKKNQLSNAMSATPKRVTKSPSHSSPVDTYTLEGYNC